MTIYACQHHRRANATTHGTAQQPSVSIIIYAPAAAATLLACVHVGRRSAIFALGQPIFNAADGVLRTSCCTAILALELCILTAVDHVVHADRCRVIFIFAAAD